MNLMFYDFNGSSVGTNTAQNFYKPPNILSDKKLNQVDEEEDKTENEQAADFRGNGDRVPTRERGYRSANLNYRRRGQTKNGDRSNNHYALQQNL